MTYRVTFDQIKEAVDSNDVLRLTSMRQQLEYQIEELSGSLASTNEELPERCRYTTREEWEPKARASLKIMKNHLELVNVGLSNRAQ